VLTNVFLILPVNTCVHHQSIMAVMWGSWKMVWKDNHYTFLLNNISIIN